MLSRNIGHKSSTDTAPHPRRTEISNVPLRKPKTRKAIWFPAVNPVTWYSWETTYNYRHLLLTRLRAAWSGVWNPVGTRVFFSPKTSNPALGSAQPPVEWKPGLFPGDRATDAWSWPFTISAEIKNEKSYTSPRPVSSWCGRDEKLAYVSLDRF